MHLWWPSANFPPIAALESHGWTYERMVAELPPESRYELADGVLLGMGPAPGGLHQDIFGNLYLLFRQFFISHPEGKVFPAPMDVELSANDVVQPDIFVVLGDPKRRVERSYKGAPELALEIVSPTSYRRDNVEKRALYARYGVKEYWVIDPANQVIEVNMLVGDTYALHAMANPEEGEPKSVTSALLPQLSVSLVEVFER